jgi:hypothetical protein
MLSGSTMETIRPWITIVITVAQFFFAGVLWLARKTFVTREDREVVDGQLWKKIREMEANVATGASSEDFSDLRLEMEGFRGSMNTFKAEMEGMKNTFTAQITRADDLVDRTERVVNMITEHLLSEQRR